MKIWLIPRNKHEWQRMAIRLLAVGALLMAGLFWMTRMPGSSFSGPPPPLTARERELADRLAAHVRKLANDIGQRNIWHPRSMAAAADSINAAFTALGYTVRRQEYTTHGVLVANLEAEIHGSDRPGEIIVVGAHYDTVLNCPGADDNASGLAALLEIARLLRNANPGRSIRFVAFANEEPPFYFTKDMGSYRYAARSRKRGEKIVAMLALETMGFYSDEPGSQQYPFPLDIFYPDTANFIAFVGNTASRRLVRRAIAGFRRQVAFPSEGIAAPGLMRGIGWSDHWSFWQHDYPAIMITDTAFFRFAQYHTPQDTPEKLAYEKMARAVLGIAGMVAELAGAKPL